MAARIELIGNSLVVTDTVTTKTLLDLPRADVYYDVERLENDSVICMGYQANLTNTTKVFKDNLEVDLADAVNNLGQAFTVASVKSFFRQSIA
jgi:hypothetical protein